mgnify:CR=1 FL=1
MDGLLSLALPAAIAVVALAYASVGHAGATGYIAVMTLCGLPVAVIRPTALALNVLVATIATLQFVRAGHGRPRLLLPLAAASAPCAILGGAISLPTSALEATLGAVLLAAAIRILAEAGLPSMRRTVRSDEPDDSACRESPRAVLAALGGGIGLVSGLTGVGGGVFLTPALLALRAAPVRQVAAVTAPFILVNSLAGLAGGLFAGRPPPAATAPVLVAAAVGGTVGASLGAFRLPASTLRLIMAAVLAFAAAKLLARPLGW